jgi:hypothetical protein
MMSIFLTEELENHTARKNDAEMLFFFCSAQDEKRNTGVAVLRGILYQIIAKRPQLIKHALPYFETPERAQQTLLSLETLWTIFTKLVTDTALGIMFCVLDGIDECDESTTRVLLPRIIGFLTDQTSSITGMFRLVVVSREIHALQGCSCSRIRVDPDNDAKVDGDIELFVSTRVQELSRIEGFNNDFRSYVQATLIQRAEGTFLWVGFAMYELLQKPTCSEILEVLDDLPTGLPAIYDRMLLQIAVRPLELEELAAAVGLQSRHPQLNTVEVARDAVARCGPLLKIQDQVVSLVHQSMRDYLLREERHIDTVLDAFRLQAEPSHLELAQKCLDCLARSSLQHEEINFRIRTNPHDPPLLRYATFNWPEHAKSCSALAAKLIDPHGFFLGKTSSLRINWWNSSKMMFLHGLEPQQLLHLACSFAIIPWVEAVLSKKNWIPRYRKRVNNKDKEGGTALHYAVASEDIALVQLLLNRGADIEAKSNDKETALHVAAGEGNTAVVQLLLDRGADIEAKSEYERRALHLAAAHRSEAVVQLLLDRGANIMARQYDGGTPLHSAALFENKTVVLSLLDRGANIEAKNLRGQTPLHYSVGNEDIVYLLVDRGADVNAKDNDGNTALQKAMVGGGEGPWSKTDPAKRKAICDFLRSRMNPSEIEDQHLNRSGSSSA